MVRKTPIGMTLAYAILISGSLLIVGCDAVVRDIDGVSVERYDSKPLTMTDMEHAIRLAAFYEKWQTVEVVDAGHFVVTKVDENGRRSASVDVLYTATQFSIHYKDTRGFRYNRLTRGIDHHYESMVEDLSERIKETVQEITLGA